MFVHMILFWCVDNNVQEQIRKKKLNKKECLESNQAVHRSTIDYYFNAMSIMFFLSTTPTSHNKERKWKVKQLIVVNTEKERKKTNACAHTSRLHNQACCHPAHIFVFPSGQQRSRDRYMSLSVKQNRDREKARMNVHRWTNNYIHTHKK